MFSCNTQDQRVTECNQLPVNKLVMTALKTHCDALRPVWRGGGDPGDESVQPNTTHFIYENLDSADGGSSSVCGYCNDIPSHS
jgi:hypothetical protein